MSPSMKSLSLFGAAAAFTGLASSTPIQKRQDDISDASDWNPILNGDDDASCADVAVIFARGTFDPGNVGPWVGGPWRDDLKSKHDSVAFQGVRSDDYEASLAGYIEDGGPDSAGESLAEDVKAYSEACPDAKIVISGWR